MSKFTESLEEEVCFWQYMVEEYQDRQSLPEYRRMTEALALAEYKLEKRLLEAGVMANPTD